jgi:hypothetical protein
MTFQKIILAASFLLIVSLPASATSDKEALQFNLGFLHMDEDASEYLHSLALLNENDEQEVKRFMEYKLDVIVCEAWENLEKMNPSQKKRAMAFLQGIKAYRAKNPRIAGTIVDVQKFSKYHEPFDSSYAQRADAILAKLE